MSCPQKRSLYQQEGWVGVRREDGRSKIVQEGHFRVWSKQNGWVGVRKKDGRDKVILSGSFKSVI